MRFVAALVAVTWIGLLPGNLMLLKAAVVDATATNQQTLIIVAVIAASANLLGVVLTAYFATLLQRVKRVSTATHAIVNHDRTILLEGNALTLLVASLDHPKDERLRTAADVAEKAAADARAGNAPADTQI